MHGGDGLAELRITLRQNGYIPVPVAGAHLDIKGAGKRPLMKDWDTLCASATDAEIRQWSKSLASSTNTGILCGEIVAIDIDVRNEPVAARLEGLAIEILGPTVLKRYGLWPKCLLVYRTDHTFFKIRTDEFQFIEGEKACVEVLATGQQFVAFGIHPITRTEYSWPDQSPCQVNVAALPSVNAEQCQRFLAAAEEVLQSAGAVRLTVLRARDRDGRKAARLKSDEAASREAIEDALRFVRNDLPYDDWVKIGFAIYAALGSGGRELWEQWSARSPKDDPAYTAEKYETFAQGHSIKIGTLFWYASQNGWTRASPGARHAQAAQSEVSIELPTIKVYGGGLPRSVNQAERALMAANLDLYQRGGLLVRPAKSPNTIVNGEEKSVAALTQVNVHHLRELMTCAANWIKFDKREMKWVWVDCPKDRADTYLGRERRWKLPLLVNITNCPMLRPDGTIMDTPGYDEATGMYFEVLKANFPAIAEKPSKSDALEAFKVLQTPLRQFPFKTEADMSVAISAIFTAVIRPSLPTAPMHGFNAPVAGSGKSLLVDIVSVIATGETASVMAQGQNEEEMEKRLDAALIGGGPIIAIDNCERPLGGEAICQMLTQQHKRVRVLGLSKLVDVPTCASLFATGNNLTLTGDLTRRALVSTLDPECERPELRKFEANPLDMVRAERERYVAAVLTILRAYHVAGRPNPPAPLGSFEGWSAWVRGAIIWLGLADPCQVMDRMRAADPEIESFRTLVDCWQKTVGLEESISSRGLAELAGEAEETVGGPVFKHPNLREALLSVASKNGSVDTMLLGHWLRRHADRVVN